LKVVHEHARARSRQRSIEDWSSSYRLTRKALQSRSASLLIKSEKCMKEELKLIVVLAQKSRHIVETCRIRQRRISPARRDHMWMGAVGKDVLLILYVIGIAQVTSVTV